MGSMQHRPLCLMVPRLVVGRRGGVEARGRGWLRSLRGLRWGDRQDEEDQEGGMKNLRGGRPSCRQAGQKGGPEEDGQAEGATPPSRAAGRSEGQPLPEGRVPRKSWGVKKWIGRPRGVKKATHRLRGVKRAPCRYEGVNREIAEN